MEWLVFPGYFVCRANSCIQTCKAEEDLKPNSDILTKQKKKSYFGSITFNPCQKIIEKYMLKHVWQKLLVLHV